MKSNNYLDRLEYWPIFILSLRSPSNLVLVTSHGDRQQTS